MWRRPGEYSRLERTRHASAWSSASECRLCAPSAVADFPFQRLCQLGKTRLAHLLRKHCFAGLRPGAGGEANREAFETAMKTVDVTFQNLDSSEISLTDVSSVVPCWHWCS